MLASTWYYVVPTRRPVVYAIWTNAMISVSATTIEMKINKSVFDLISGIEHDGTTFINLTNVVHELCKVITSCHRCISHFNFACAQWSNLVYAIQRSRLISAYCQKDPWREIQIFLRKCAHLIFAGSRFVNHTNNQFNRPRMRAGREEFQLSFVFDFQLCTNLEIVLILICDAHTTLWLSESETEHYEHGMHNLQASVSS